MNKEQLEIKANTILGISRHLKDEYKGDFTLESLQKYLERKAGIILVNLPREK